MACFEKNLERFTKLYETFKSKQNSYQSLIWCVQAGWSKMVTFLLFQEKVSPHQEPYNILCEAIRFNQTILAKYLLYNSDFREPEYFPQVIEAIHLAEHKCQHELALYLLYFLFDHTSEAVLSEKFGFKISDSLRIYMHQKDYIRHTRPMRRVHYLLPIVEVDC
jgi:hypothetical protein